MTDFLPDVERSSRMVTLARTVKPSEALSDARTIAKLEIERRYWTSRGVDWGIVTERDLPPILLRNLDFLQGCVLRFLEDGRRERLLWMSSEARGLAHRHRR